MNRSQALNTIYKKIFGSTIDETISALPLGARHLVGGLRNTLENMVVKHIFESLAHLGVGKIVEETLLAGYGYTTDQIRDYMGTPRPSKKKAEGEELAIAQLVEGYEKELLHNSSSSHDKDARAFEKFIEQSSEGTITLRRVLDSYEVRLKEYFNDQLRETLLFAIEKATPLATNLGIDLTVAGVKKVLFGGTVVTAPFSPAAAIGAVGFGLLAEEMKPTVKGYLAPKATGIATYIAQRNLSQQIIPIDYSKDGITVTKHDLEGWVDITYVAPTFANWAREAFKPAARALEKAYNPSYNSGDIASNIVWEKGIRYDAKTGEGYTRPDNPYIAHPLDTPKYKNAEVSEEELDDLEWDHQEALKEDRDLRIKVAKEAAEQGAKKNDKAPSKGLFGKLKGWFGM
jgi:hypothetical protein